MNTSNELRTLLRKYQYGDINSREIRRLVQCIVDSRLLPVLDGELQELVKLMCERRLVKNGDAVLREFFS